MCHLYGIKPWEVQNLTTNYYNLLVGQMGDILYLRDRAMLNYHFGKLSDENRQALVDSEGVESDPNSVDAQARRVFLASYNLEEYRQVELTPMTIEDLSQALKNKKVPNWALNLLSPAEFRGIQ